MTSHEDEVRELSRYPHEYLKLHQLSEDSEQGWVSPTSQAPLEEADVITSRITTGSFEDEHTLMIDLDVPARLVPSTTPGNSHLYIDVPMSWYDCKNVLDALAAAGILQRGYVRASKRRGYTALRLPWVKKGQPEEDPF